MERLLNLLWIITPDFIGDAIHRFTGCWWTKSATSCKCYHLLERYPLRPELGGEIKGRYLEHYKAALERGAVPLENVTRYSVEEGVVFYIDPRLGLPFHKLMGECEVI